jgi:hypothetical protein
MALTIKEITFDMRGFAQEDIPHINRSIKSQLIQTPEELGRLIFDLISQRLDMTAEEVTE